MYRIIYTVAGQHGDRIKEQFTGVDAAGVAFKRFYALEDHEATDVAGPVTWAAIYQIRRDGKPTRLDEFTYHVDTDRRG